MPSKPLSEAQFQKQVLALAKLRGWRVAHFKTAQTAKGAYVTPVAADGKGFPDLVMVRAEPGFVARLIFAELKADRGRLGPQQLEWIQALAESDAEMYVWRPADWDEIEEVLK
jgi:hypothetical protein